MKAEYPPPKAESIQNKMLHTIYFDRIRVGLSDLSCGCRHLRNDVKEGYMERMHGKAPRKTATTAWAHMQIDNFILPERKENVNGKQKTFRINEPGN